MSKGRGWRGTEATLGRTGMALGFKHVVRAWSRQAMWQTDTSAKFGDSTVKVGKGRRFRAGLSARKDKMIQDWTKMEGAPRRQRGEGRRDISDSEREENTERMSKGTRVLTSISRHCTSAGKSHQPEGLSPSWGTFPTSLWAQLQGKEFTPFQKLFMIPTMASLIRPQSTNESIKNLWAQTKVVLLASMFIILRFEEFIPLLVKRSFL